MILLYHKFDYLLIEKQTETLNCFFLALCGKT